MKDKIYQKTPRQKRQYIESALREINELTTQQTNIIQKLTRDKTIAQLTEITDDIRTINEMIRNRMEGSNWGKYN